MDKLREAVLLMSLFERKNIAVQRAAANTITIVMEFIRIVRPFAMDESSLCDRFIKIQNQTHHGGPGGEVVFVEGLVARGVTVGEECFRSGGGLLVFGKLVLVGLQQDSGLGG